MAKIHTRVRERFMQLKLGKKFGGKVWRREKEEWGAQKQGMGIFLGPHFFLSPWMKVRSPSFLSNILASLVFSLSRVINFRDIKSLVRLKVHQNGFLMTSSLHPCFLI